jgi:uncharacterized protein (TIGR00369 family)
MLCLGCTAVGRCQLGIDRVAVVGDHAIRAEVVAPANFEGGTGVAHGGWIAAVITEVLGQAPALHGRLAVTADLSVRYLRPVPIGRPLIVTGRIAARVAGRWTMTAEVHLEDDADVLAAGRGTWIERTAEHYVRHQEWLSERDNP